MKKINQDNYYHQRLQKLYEKEISLIFQQLIIKNNWPYFSVSFCQLSARMEVLKIYLIFANEQEENFLSELNKRYKTLIIHYLLLTKKFPRLPQLFFLLDHVWKKIISLQKLIPESQK